MFKIGITGGIGSGKSIVCQCFTLLGVPVYDSDSRAKWVMHHNPELREALLTAFGSEVYDAQQNLNRTYLAQRVFNNAEELAKLNGLVHPQVRKDFYDWAEENAEAPYILKEAALMFESNAYTQVDAVLTVSAPVEVRLARTLQRDTHRTSKDIEAIMARQLSEEERCQRAQYIIYNNNTQLVLPQVVSLHQTFLQLAAEKEGAI